MQKPYLDLLFLGKFYYIRNKGVNMNLKNISIFDHDDSEIFILNKLMETKDFAKI